jgi:molybdate transport system substrate-binding protein
MAAALLVAACGRAGAAAGGARPATGPSVTVLAAASLTEAFQDLRGGPAATYSFAGSQQLVAQVEAGAPADVVATADGDAMARLEASGLVEPEHAFATNRLAIAVAAANPERIDGLAGLSRAGLKVVLADPSVPAGRYARQVLDRAGVVVRPVSLELDVKAVVRKVSAGEADAGIVYATDAGPGSGVTAVPIPDGANVAVTYPVAVVKAGRNADAARAFVALLLGPTGRAALLRHGFGPP